MTEEEIFYQLALTQVSNIGSVHARLLINHFENPKNIFKATKKELENIEGIGSIRATSIKTFHHFTRIEEELKFTEKYKVEILCFQDEAFPQRLNQLHDAPILLFKKGNINLNNKKIVAVIGTRTCSNYGKQITEKLIEELAGNDVVTISGLAAGIDTLAHKYSLENNIGTIAVLGHGLDQIYPVANKNLAKDIINNGALISEFMSKTIADKQNFPRRNRIVAGMCDTVVVVETAIKGGSLITTALADGYNKEVMAFPGRVGDSKSEGCNYLIQKNKAILIQKAADILTHMNWDQSNKKKKIIQKELFLDLNKNEQLIYDELSKSDIAVHIDELYFNCNLNSTEMASSLLQMELQGIVKQIPGKRYLLD